MHWINKSQRMKFLAAFFITTTITMGTGLNADEPPNLGIDPERITVSGMSSGAHMAHQLHLAYSELFSGAALLAGGPYACAEGSIRHALGRCLGKPGTAIPVDTLVQIAREAAEDGRIAPLVNLTDDSVWIFHGSLDSAVPESVNAALVLMYQKLAAEAQIETVNDVPAAHTFPADGSGGACDTVESPFVGDCGYDAAGRLLQHLYPEIKAPQGPVNTALIEVELAGAEAANLDTKAWLFVPPACQARDANCALHLVLHGCAQSASQVGTAFMEQSGYLTWAEANDMVLAFPQSIASMTNALACWDWWGYSGENYLWRDGKQMQLLADWVSQLAGLDDVGTDRH